MIRKIIKIDEEKCNGCGLCAVACHEGAIDIVDNKAKLMRENYCDGLGDCLPACPMNAISFEEREAPAYDEAAVKAAQAAKATKNKKKTAIFSGCPSSKAKTIERPKNSAISSPCESQLSQWPVQIKLLPITAPYFDEADILIAADCTAYAYGDFHNKFIKGRITLVGCPKLDEGDYTEKLTAIFANNNIKSVTMTRMIVPCCGALERAAKNAIKNSKKEIPFEVYTISTDGSIL